jgi:hypothetical protein
LKQKAPRFPSIYLIFPSLVISFNFGISSKSFQKKIELSEIIESPPNLKNITVIYRGVYGMLYRAHTILIDNSIIEKALK